MDAKPMTAWRWPRATDARDMIEHLGQQASDRKLRLFACACCRRASHLAHDERLPRWLQYVEDVADNRLTTKRWERAYREYFVARQAVTSRAQSLLFSVIDNAMRPQLDRGYFWLGQSAVSAFRTRVQGLKEERQHAALIREIFGNPFRPVTVDPKLRTSDVMALATGIYDERDFSAMPILADALQDAGCDSDDILNHLRDANATHVRGCWALDLILGKS